MEKNPANWESLAERLRDPDLLVRERAACRLAECEDLAVLRRVLDRLLGAAEDPSPRVRECVAVALRESHDPRALPALIRLGEDRNPIVQRVAIHQLGIFGDRAAVEPLLRAFEDTVDLHIREEIMAALDLLGHPTPALRDRIEVLDPIRMVLAWAENGRPQYSDCRNERALAANIHREGRPVVDRLAAILRDLLHTRSERILDLVIALSADLPPSPNLEAALREMASDEWFRALDPRALQFINRMLKESGAKRTPYANA